jgi:hypothetical protein
MHVALALPSHLGINHEVFRDVMACVHRPLTYPSPQDDLREPMIPIAVYCVIEFTYVYVGHAKWRRNRSYEKDGSDH